MTVFFAIVFGLYFLGLTILLSGWFAAQRSQPPESSQAAFKITIVVPFRNEEKNIAALIRDIHAQRNAGGSIEVILVDDHSTDRSFDLASGLAGVFPEFKIIRMPVGKEGKKRAIDEAIQIASGQIIVTTDADCRLPDSWISSVHHAFQRETVKMVFGGIRMRENGTFFSRLQAQEFCSLVGTAAATAGLGIPILCNGASLAFTKAAFTAVGGYEGNLAIASGDDEFLLHKIHRRFPGSISFLADSRSVVETAAAETPNSFISQRLRWAGKWKHNNSLASQSIAVFVLLFQLSFILVWFLFPWRNVDTVALISVSLLLGKLLLEYYLLSEVGKFLKVKIRLLDMLALQFIYPFYVVFIGTASLFASPAWKGRR